MFYMAQEHCYAVAEVYYIICVWLLSVAAPGHKFRWGRLFCKLYILISEHKILAEMSLCYPVGGTLMLIDRLELEVMLHA